MTIQAANTLRVTVHRAPEPTMAAANALLADLSLGQPVDTAKLKAIMTAAYGASDADGAWDWKDAYNAGEIATVLFLRKFGPGMLKRAASPAAMAAMLTKVAALLPTHTKRSEESQALQQYSTPVGLSFAVVTAAAITPDDVVLEPSAGTGLLAVFGALAGATLALNELSVGRAGYLRAIFTDATVSTHDAAQIHDRLDPAIRPSVIVMNPPFSADANVVGSVCDAAVRHIASALARLTTGGRLVAITGASLAPESAAWRAALIALQQSARIVFTAPIDGRAYAKHGTTFDTRLTVIDKIANETPDRLVASRRTAMDAVDLLALIAEAVPPRQMLGQAKLLGSNVVLKTTPGPQRTPYLVKPTTPVEISANPLAYDAIDWTPTVGAMLTETLYEYYTPQSIKIPASQPHPTRLVQSAAMASVAPPKPSYRPHLPSSLVTDGILSEAQLESIIMAGEAHTGMLAGKWRVDATFDNVTAAADTDDVAVEFRRGWMLGDGTGAGKGRQAAGIILDNWTQGRRRALWISKSDKLLEDAQRDWSALGQERMQVTPLSRFKQGTPIKLAEGILFTTYATLRSEARNDKAARVAQIATWLGRDFDGVIIFDDLKLLEKAKSNLPTNGLIVSYRVSKRLIVTTRGA